MSQVYTRHPLLVNPLKWLRGVKKRHVPHLYLDSYYEPKCISSNPFLASLASTRQDVSRSRFPTGNMIQMIVETTEGEDKERYLIRPVLHKPADGQNPASYIIDNKSYINFLMSGRFRPVPMKYHHRSSGVASQISISKTFADDVESLLRTSFTTSLTRYEPKDISEGNGILLKPSPSFKWEWRRQMPVIYTDLVENDTFLDYTKDTEMCSIIVKLVWYLHT